jgi:hypothetical protein
VGGAPLEGGDTMNVQKIFGSYIDGAKEMLRKEIETEIEENLEHERDDAFTTGVLEYCDKICLMGQKQKEVLRVDTLRSLDDQKSKIIALWELYVDRTVAFSIWFDIYMYTGVFFSIVTLFLKLYVIMAVFLAFSILMAIASHSPAIYVKLCYFFTGTGGIIKKLFTKYNRYGKLEAKLTLADDCDFLDFKREYKKWLYTTSHK